MNLTEESFKTIRASHLLGIAVSAATLVLLFAPFENDYRDALKEASLLKRLSTTGYDKYAHDAFGLQFASPDFLPHDNNQQYVGAGLRNFMARFLCCVNPEAANDWFITPVLIYEPPPIGKPLQEWIPWMTQTTRARYRNPDWTDAYVAVDTRQPSGEAVKKEPSCEQCSPTDLRALVFFSVRPENPLMSGQQWYRFRAYFDQALQRKQPEPWWQSFEAMPTTKLREQAVMEGLRKQNRSVVEGSAPVLATIEQNSLPPISAWIKNDPSTRELFESTRVDDTGLPHLREHWSVLSSKTLDEAIGYMEQEQKHIRDISLFGLSVPGSLCLVAIPLAFAVSHLYLVLHLTSVAAASRTMKDPPSHFPWIGLYQETLAKIVTTLTLTVMPALLCTALIFRYHTKLGLLSIIPASLLTGIALFIGCIASIQAASLRQGLLRIQDSAAQGAFE